MNPEHKKYILENIKKNTIREISSALHLKERIVRRFLEKEGGRQNKDLAEAKEDHLQEKKVAQRKGKFIISACIIAIIVICAFAPAVKNDFINWDDPAYVSENIYLNRISLANIKALLTTSFRSTYQPVVNISYLIEHHFFGLNAAFYHATNILLHLLNCIFVFWLILLLDGNIFVSLLSALLFGLHPLRVESVAWISERKDVLYSFFFLWALVDYCRYIRNNSIKYYYRSLFLFLLALGSKAMAAVLPLVFFAVDYLLKRKADKKIILEKVPFFILAFLFGLLAVFAQGKALGLGHGEPFVLSQRIAAPLYGIIMYFCKTVFPVNLSLIYPYPPPNAGFYLICLLSVILISFIVGAAVISRRFTRKVIFSFLFAFITILLVLQFIPVGTAIMADRYTYLPSIGICYIASVGFFYLYRMKHRYTPLLKAAQIIFLAGIITALFLLTYNRTQVWKNSITIFSDVIKKYPDVYMAYHNRGFAYEKQGDFAQAISDYTKALDLEPNCASAYNNRGIVYFRKGDYDQAVIDYTKALDLEPDYVEAYNNRGLAYVNKGNYDEAVIDCTKAIGFKPDYAGAYNSRGIAYGNQGKLSQAISDFTKAIEINPNLAEAYGNRGFAYYGEKEYNKAWEDVRKAKELRYAVNPEFFDALKKASGRED